MRGTAARKISPASKDQMRPCHVSHTPSTISRLGSAHCLCGLDSPMYELSFLSRRQRGDKRLKIARKVGLPQNIDLVTEPEAAALAVLKEKIKEGEFLKMGDCFVVCDAGSGTVDLISYKVIGLDPPAVEECAVIVVKSEKKAVSKNKGRKPRYW